MYLPFFCTASRLNVMHLNREGSMRSPKQQVGNIGNRLALVCGKVHCCWPVLCILGI